METTGRVYIKIVNPKPSSLKTIGFGPKPLCLEFVGFREITLNRAVLGSEVRERSRTLLWFRIYRVWGVGSEAQTLLFGVKGLECGE